MVTLLALLVAFAAVVASGAVRAARADDADVVSAGRAADGDVIALVQTPHRTDVAVPAIARAGTTTLAAQTSRLVAANRPVILVIDAAGASTPEDLHGLQRLAAGLLLRIGTSAPVTVVATGTSPVVLATGSDAVATRINDVNQLRLSQARTGVDKVASAVQAGLLETAGAAAGRTVVVLEGPAGRGAPQVTGTLGATLAAAVAVPLVATPGDDAASWAGVVERTGGDVVAAPLANWSATLHKLATTLTTGISIKFRDPGTAAPLSVVVGGGTEQRVLPITLAGRHTVMATPAPRRRVGWLAVGGAALLVLLAAAVLVVLTRRPRRRKRRLLRLPQHAPGALRPNMLQSRPRHLDGRQAPGLPQHQRSARTARPQPPQAGHRRSGAVLHAGVQPARPDEALTPSGIRAAMDRAARRDDNSDYAVTGVTPAMRAPLGAPMTSTSLDPVVARPEPAAVVAEIGAHSANGEPSPRDEPASREPHELIQSVDQWRTAGSTGDLATLLDGLVWLQESWPSPSSYESRLHAALQADLQRVGKQYARGEVSAEKGYETVSGVVQVIDALWENRSAMPPMAAPAMSRAAENALADAQGGDSTHAFELLDVLSSHWSAVRQEQAGNDAVRIALLDVSAFWSVSFPADRDAVADLAGFESLVEHVDQLFAVRAAAAARQGEGLQKALVALLARWEPTDSGTAVTQNAPAPVADDEITPNLREERPLRDDES